MGLEWLPGSGEERKKSHGGSFVIWKEHWEIGGKVRKKALKHIRREVII